MNQLTIDQQIKRKVREINERVQAGKPAYWNQSSAKKYRIFRARYFKGRFQIQPIAPQKWMDAQITDIFELCR